MSLLLDTLAFLWWITDSPRLPGAARQGIADPNARIYWSAASSWEVAIKYALGRLPLPKPPADYLPRQLELNGIRPMPITDAHALGVANLPPHHDDPFDRMLVAQALAEGLVLVSGDPVMHAYDVKVLWK